MGSSIYRIQPSAFFLDLSKLYYILAVSLSDILILELRVFRRSWWKLVASFDLLAALLIVRDNHLTECMIHLELIEICSFGL